MAYTRPRVILVAGLRYVPFLLCIVLDVIHTVGRKSSHYTSVLPTANTANEWGNIALLTLDVYHRIHTYMYLACRGTHL